MGLFRNFSHVLAALFNNRAEFHRRWNEPAHHEERWQGEWVSTANGHRGALKCVLTPVADEKFQASFHAVYAKVLTVCYTVPLHGKKGGSKHKLEGQADLGQLAGGVYHYAGEMDAETFECTYRCRYDHGKFHLKRLRR